MSLILTHATSDPSEFETIEDLQEFLLLQKKELQSWYFQTVRGNDHKHAAELLASINGVLNLLEHGTSATDSDLTNALNQLSAKQWDPEGTRGYKLVFEIYELYGAEVANLMWVKLASGRPSQKIADLSASLFAAEMDLKKSIKNSEIRKLIERLHERDKYFKEREDVLFAASEKAQDRLQSQFDSNLADLLNNYKEFASFSEPKNYWEEKRRYHENMASKHFSSLLRLIGWIAGGFLLLVMTFAGLFHNIVEYKTSVPFQIYLAISGFLVLLSTSAFWAIRVAVRLYLSHVHLQSDADERVVMAKTYLALHFGNQVRDEDRSIILSALFRHTTDGVVHDDAAPVVRMVSMKDIA